MSLHRFERATVIADLSETALHVARRMRDFHVGCVVVVRRSHPIGIVTDRDLAIRVLAEGLDPAATRVSDIVTYDATTVGRDADIETVARTMRDRGVRRLPIVDVEGRITGIVTADDLTMLLARELGDIGAGLSDAVDVHESR